MKLRNKWTFGFLALGAAALIGVSATTLGSTVYAQTESEDATPAADSTILRWNFEGEWGRDFARGADHSAMLAEALGISEEELEAAVLAARNALIDQAVEDGEITQAQADRMKEQDNVRGLGWGPQGNAEAYQLALAEALGITVDALETAQDEAQALVLAQAVEDGRITQEEADMIAARQALQEYLRDEMQSAYEEAVAQAVAEGIITQEQADAILAEQTPGFFGPRDFGPGIDGGRSGHPFDGPGGPRDGRGSGPDGGRDGGRNGGMWRNAPQQEEDDATESSTPLFELPSINF